MDVWTIDFWANNWDSAFHRASTIAKVTTTAIIVASVVLTDSFIILAIIYISLATVVVSTRLPARKILSIAAYPGFFAILFALSRWDGSLLTPAVVVLKALTAALAMLILITTTPYPDIFAMLQFIMPRVVADSLFLAYRSLFILLALMGDLVSALRLRGGLRRRHYIRNVRNIAMGLGLLLVRALALSERLYDVMRIRGYSGKMTGSRRWQRVTQYDVAPLGLGLWIAGLAAGFRLLPETVSAYNGYFLSLSVLALIASIIYSEWPHEIPLRRR